MKSDKNILVLAIGNEILGDESAAIIAGRELKSIFKDKIDFQEVSSTGLELFEIFENYNKVLILTPIKSEPGNEGLIHEFSTFSDFSHNNDLHYIDFNLLPKLAKSMDYHIPETIKILAIEISRSLDITDKTSFKIKNTIPNLVQKSISIINKLE